MIIQGMCSRMVRFFFHVYAPKVINSPGVEISSPKGNTMGGRGGGGGGCGALALLKEFLCSSSYMFFLNLICKFRLKGGEITELPEYQNVMRAPRFEI